MKGFDMRTTFLGDGDGALSDWHEVRDMSGEQVEALRASFSTDNVVSGVSLSHNRGAIDTTRFKRGKGLPVLFNHDRDVLLGNATNPRIEGGRLMADIIPSVTDQNKHLWDQIRAGDLHSTSLHWHARFEDAREQDDHIVVDKWFPSEVSVVTVPDDVDTGVMRAFREFRGDTAAARKAATGDTDMSDKDTGGGTVAPTDFKVIESVAKREGHREGERAMLERTNLIHEIFDRSHLRNERGLALRDDLIRKGATVEQAQSAALDLLSGAESPGSERSFTKDDPDVKPGEDQSEKWHTAAVEAIAVRGGVERDDKVKSGIRSNPLFGMSIMDLARDYLKEGGHDDRVSRDRLLDMIGRRSMPTHGSSDFPSVFANVANKAAVMGWDDAPKTWRAFCRIGNLTDFKPSLRLGLGGMSDLEEVPASGELPGLSASDVGENIQLTTRGGYFGLNRQAVINDDINAFADTGRKLGMAAARVPNDLAYAILFSNPVLSQDATAFFAAGHSNIVTGTSNAGPNVADMNAIELAMGLQQGPSPGPGLTGNDLNIEVATIVVPKKFSSVARQLAVDQNVPGGSSNPELNIWANRFEPVAEAKVDRDNTDKGADFYYAFANPAIWPAIEVAFLDGVEAPRIEEIPPTSTVLGMVWRVYLDVGAAALDFRPAVRVDVPL